MTALLILFLLAAVGCVLYAVLAFRRRSPSPESEETAVYLRENGDHVDITYGMLKLQGSLLLGADEDRFYVSEIHVTLKSPHSLLKNFSRRTLYQIEKRLYERYPAATIIWEPPLSLLEEALNEPDSPGRI